MLCGPAGLVKPEKQMQKGLLQRGFPGFIRPKDQIDPGMKLERKIYQLAEAVDVGLLEKHRIIVSLRRDQ